MVIEWLYGCKTYCAWGEVLNLVFQDEEADSDLEEDVSEQENNMEENSNYRHCDEDNLEEEYQAARKTFKSKNYQLIFTSIKLQEGWQQKMSFEWLQDLQDWLLPTHLTFCQHCSSWYCHLLCGNSWPYYEGMKYEQYLSIKSVNFKQCSSSINILTLFIELVIDT